MAPPSRTANRSSEIAPNTIFCRQTYDRPSLISCQREPGLVSGLALPRMLSTSIAERPYSAKVVK